MKALEPAELARLAALAQLELDPAAQAETAAELGHLLGMVDLLRAAPLEHIEPMAHPLGLACPLREDRAESTPPAATWLALAAEAAGEMFLVPRYVE